MLLFSAGTFDNVCKTLDKVRQFVAEQLGEVPQGQHNLLWVTDFPMFGWNEEEKRMEVRCRVVLTHLAGAIACQPELLRATAHAGDAPSVHSTER